MQIDQPTPRTEAETQNHLARQSKMLEKLLLEKYEPIAIVGIGLDLPGNNKTLQEFSEFLAMGGDGICRVPEDRWDISAHYSGDAEAKGKIRTEAGGYLQQIDLFDSPFFNISPKEADYIDPQQRIILETAWRALEDANIDPNRIDGTHGGVYVGVSSMDYTLEVDALPYEDYTGHIGTGTAHSAVSGRVSFFLGWRGPSVSVDTACSSSLVALHQAVQGLRARECNIALCGGVNIIHHPRNMVIFSQANMLAPDGRCKTFDDSADGYGRSEGCGMVVLKRLSDAVKDGDRIIAQIRSTAVRQDGESGGLTVPNGIAQQQVMQAALEAGLLKKEEISYVEAHGTGTSLGDPIEIGAIDALMNTPHRTRPIFVGSAKTNLGHMEAAAGIGGIIKCALQLRSRQIFPHINLHTPSTKIPWNKLKVKVPTALESWECDSPRRALVNSFGFSGTIASAVLEEAPNSKKRESRSTVVPPILTVSAKSKTALLCLLNEYKQRIAEASAEQINSICYSSNVGRSVFRHRASFPCFSRDQLSNDLDVTIARLKGSEADLVSPDPEKTAFLYTGQGSQYPEMAKELYDSIPLFREVIDQLDRAFAKELDVSVRDLLISEKQGNHERLNQTKYTQPALFALEYALTVHLNDLGVRPDVLIGHSIGELVAATVAGVFRVEDAVRIVSARARLMQSVKTPGSMLAVREGAEKVMGLLPDNPEVALAGINAPQQCVLSGTTAAIEAAEDLLKRENIDSIRLAVSHAFHSPLMKEVYGEFRQVFTGITLREPAIPIVSNVTGNVATSGLLTDPEYWISHIGEPVRFAQGIQALAQLGACRMIEVGPDQVLSKLGRSTVKDSRHAWISCLRRDESTTRCFTSALAAMAEAGARLNWTAYHGDERAHADIPHYPFERKQHWLPVKQRHASPGEVSAAHPLLGKEVTEDGSERRTFRSCIDPTSPAYLAEHVVMGKTIFPGAGFVEILIALQDALQGSFALDIRDLDISEPLILQEDPVFLYTHVTENAEAYAVEICSVPVGLSGSVSRSHARASLAKSNHQHTQLNEIDPEMVKAIRQVAVQGIILESEDIYSEFSTVGLDYGPQFRRIHRLTKTTDQLAIAQLTYSETPDAQFLPPFLLDSALQCVLGVASPSGGALLPVGIQRFKLWKKPRGDLRVVLRRAVNASPNADMAVDFLAADAQGMVFELHGLQLKAVVSKSAAASQLFHAPKWVKQSLVANQNLAQAPVELWLLGDRLPELEQIAETEYDGRITIHRLKEADDFLNLYAPSNAIIHLAYCWTPQSTPSEVSELSECLRANHTQLLKLVALLEADAMQNKEVCVWLVSEGGQWLQDDVADGSHARLAAASQWGFGHVLLNEFPRIDVRMVDLPPPNCHARSEIELLTEILAHGGGASEPQVAYRDGVRSVKRIVKVQPGLTPDQANIELKITEYGLFENIKSVPTVIPEPEDDQIKVEVHSVGLNFKDVLNALGMLKQYAEEKGIPYHELPLGFEAAGVVNQAGIHSGFKVGDRVIVSHLGCMKRFITIPALAAVKMPEQLTFDEAAGISTPFITAYYSLYKLAKLKAGDRVLIHAAAGGVGQAAIQLAKARGADIYATASPGKWAFLRSQGVKQVFNSRTLDFAEQVNEATNGEGVDVILNSLSGEFIDKSLSCLADKGRFIEIGKIGVLSQEEFALRRSDASYENFDLSELPEQDLLKLNHAILRHVVELLAEGSIAPLRATAYAIDELVEAFSVLSRGGNVGKLVIRMVDQRPNPSDLTITSDQVYVVTGAWGALGKTLMRKLSNLGARHIVAISRRCADDHQVAEIQDDCAQGTKIYSIAADIGVSESLDSLFNQLDSMKYPVHAIFHAAGVLDDAPITKQTPESFARVCAAKVQGSYLLDKLARRLSSNPILVAFSSIASLLGSMGQSNYAAANSYMDQLMLHRAAEGLRSLSVNWGPWGEIGMAARMDEKQKRSIESKGIFFLSTGDAIRALWAAMRSCYPQLAVCEFDWDTYVGSLLKHDPLYDRLLSGERLRESKVSLADLRALESAQRELSISSLLRERIAKILHYEDADQIAMESRFSDLGLDSLVAVEMKNSLESIFSVSLPTSLVFDYPSIPALARYLSDAIDSEPTTAPNSDPLDEMEDAAIDAELASMMESA